MLHAEGAQYIISRAFRIGGSYGAFRQWEMGICGLNTTGPDQTPPGWWFTYQYVPPYDENTPYANMIAGVACEGGALDSVHRGIFSYARQPVQLAAESLGRSMRTSTSPANFVNHLQWEPRGVDPGYREWSNRPWESLHRWPWVNPFWDVDTFPDPPPVPDPNPDGTPSWALMLATDPYTGVTFSVGLAFIASVDAPRVLLASSRFLRPIQIPPGGALVAPFESLIRPTASTAAFLEVVTRRAFESGYEIVPGGYRCGLSCAPEIRHDSTLADVQEVDYLVSEGYDRIELSEDWTLEPDGFSVRASTPWSNTFENTGTAPWQTVTHVFVSCAYIGGSGGKDNLAFWYALPAPIILQPGERIIVPNGVVWSLTNHD